MIIPKSAQKLGYDSFKTPILSHRLPADYRPRVQPRQRQQIIACRIIESQSSITHTSFWQYVHDVVTPILKPSSEWLRLTDKTLLSQIASPGKSHLLHDQVNSLPASRISQPAGKLLQRCLLLPIWKSSILQCGILFLPDTSHIDERQNWKESEQRCSVRNSAQYLNLTVIMCCYKFAENEGHFRRHASTHAYSRDSRTSGPTPLYFLYSADTTALHMHCKAFLALLVHFSTWESFPRCIVSISADKEA